MVKVQSRSWRTLPMSTATGPVHESMWQSSRRKGAMPKGSAKGGWVSTAVPAARNCREPTETTLCAEEKR